MSSYRCVHALVVPKAKHHHRLCGQPARRDYPESITFLSVRVSLSPRDLEAQAREETFTLLICISGWSARSVPDPELR
jgi:hypothetical protein